MTLEELKAEERRLHDIMNKAEEAKSVAGHEWYMAYQNIKKFEEDERIEKLVEERLSRRLSGRTEKEEEKKDES